MKAQKMENLSIAFNFMLDVEHIPLVNIGMYFFYSLIMYFMDWRTHGLGYKKQFFLLRIQALFRSCNWRHQYQTTTADIVLYACSNLL